MGIFFSRKVQKNSKELLEDLEKKISSKTHSKRRNQQYERSFVSYLLLLSFLLYLVGVAVLYLYFRPSNWVEWLGYLTPLLFFPLVVYLIKRVLNLYFSNRKTQFDQELATLYEEKRRVLNEVMEKETYKTAIELLQRYEPTHPSLQQHKPQPPPDQSASSQQATPTRRSEVRRRNMHHTPHPSQLQQQQTVPTPAPPSSMQPNSLPSSTPARPVSAASLQQPVSTASLQQPVASLQQPVGSLQQPATPTHSEQFIPPGMCLGAPPGPPTPCPILPRERTNVDRVVEFLVGDGPNNRYALVCSKCHSHNGMALRDEFEYMSFRCAYCYELNRARKKKPSLAVPATPASSTEGEEVSMRKSSRVRKHRKGSEEEKSETDHNGKQEDKMD